MDTDLDYKYLFKLLLIGDSSVGKSSLFLRFSDNCFAEGFSTTIGVDFKIRTVTVAGQTCKLQIWDTAGQERFRAITLSYYRKAHGILVVFDLTNQRSFETVGDWLASVRENADAGALTMLVGNKNDLVDQRKVSKEQAEQFAAAQNMEYVETSAKESANVEKAFFRLAENLVQQQEKLEGSRLKDGKSSAIGATRSLTTDLSNAPLGREKNCPC